MVILNTFTFLTIGFICLFLFQIDIFLPFSISLILFAIVSLFLWSRYKKKRVGVLVLFLWLAYSLPFIHIIPYLWFDFTNEDPLVLWGLKVNPYMTDKAIINLTAMIGAVGGIGFASGVSLNGDKIIRDFGLKINNHYKYIKTLSLPVWIAWIICGVILSWLAAPESTLFSAAYTESNSILENANFGSAWMLSYAIIGFALCDAIFDQNTTRRVIKKKIVFGVITFVLLFLQFLRGDRAAIPFVFSALVVNFYWAAHLTQKHEIEIKMKYVFTSILMLTMLFVFSMILGATRHSLIDIKDVGQLVELLLDLYESDSIGISNILHGTWSAVLLTPLSVAGDHINKVLPLKLGEDYLNFFLSIPPGFIADAVGYIRPIEDGTGPPKEMIYGQGGTHASVVPFMNFRLLGVLVIPAVWAYIISSCEKKALKKLNVTNLALLCTIALATPHWLWYGEKNGMNAFFIWFLLAFLYQLSLSLTWTSSAVSSSCLHKNLKVEE